MQLPTQGVLTCEEGGLGMQGTGALAAVTTPRAYCGCVASLWAAFPHRTEMRKAWVRGQQQKSLSVSGDSLGMLGSSLIEMTKAPNCSVLPL